MSHKKKHRRFLACLCVSALLCGCSSSQTPSSEAAVLQKAEDTFVPEIQEEQGIGNMKVRLALNAAQSDGVTRSGMEHTESRNAVDRASLDNRPSVSKLKPLAKKSRTVMVYLVGSDLESNPKSKAGTNDLSEMMSSGLDDEDVNLVVCAGGANTWWNGLPGKKNSFLVYTSQNNGDFQVYDFGDANMAQKETLENFLSTSVENFPADQYSLIFWDHGNGPYVGYGIDEVYEDRPDPGKLSNVLTVPDITNAIDRSKLKNQTIEMIGFDACLMGSVEIVNAFAPYTKTLVASAETEPGCGWDYSWLKILNKNPDTMTFSKEIVDTYADYLLSNHPSSDYTLDVYDLNAQPLKKTNDACAALVSKMNSYGKDIKSYSDLVLAGTESMFYGHDYGLELFDADNIARNLNEFCGTESFRNDLGAVISYGQTNMRGSGGLSLYLPLGATDCIYEYKSQDWAKNYRPAGVDQLEKTSIRWLTEFIMDEGSDSRSGSLNEDEEFYVIEIPSELKEQTIKAKAVVMCELIDSEETSHIALQDEPLEIKDGKVLLSKDPDIILAGDEDGTDIVRARHLLRREDRDDYVVEAYLRTSGMMDTLFENVHTRIDLKAENGEISVRSISTLPVGGESVLFDETDGENNADLMMQGMASSRLSISTDCLDLIHFPIRSGAKNADLENGTLWKNCLDEGWVIGPDFNLSKGIEFYQLPISRDPSHAYSAQVILEDAAGKETVLGRVEFPSAREKMLQVKTEKGTLYFEEEDGKATLKMYEGEDTLVDIPESVDSLPVTAIAPYVFDEGSGNFERTFGSTITEIQIPDSVQTIGSGAFSNLLSLKTINLPDGLKSIEDSLFKGSRDLDELIIPESVESIGDEAFRGSGLHKLTVPSSVKTIGQAAMVGIHAYNEDFERLPFELDLSKNKNFKLKGTQLMSADGKRLLADIGNPTYDAESFSREYPEELSVEPGVETIDAGAFMNYGSPFMTEGEEAEGVRSLKLPDSVKTIGDYAFLGLANLDTIELPPNLEELGAFAFSSDLYRVRPAKTVHVSIPASCKAIGYGAFEAYDGLYFEVDDDNTQYSAKDGTLYNFAMDTPINVYNPEMNREIYDRGH